MSGVVEPDRLVDRGAPVERLMLDEGSWVDVVRGFAPDASALFEHLLEHTAWKQSRSIREGRMIPDPRMGAGMSEVQTRAHPVLHRARLVLEARYRIRLSGLGLVLYRDGRDSVGLHSDDEMLYLDDTIVASLGLGATRRVVFAPRGGREAARVEVSLAQGDLYVMGGRCQADWMHGVPKLSPGFTCGPRISVVWRWTSRRGPPSSSPTRFVADAPKKRRLR